MLGLREAFIDHRAVKERGRLGLIVGHRILVKTEPTQ
jgi:hypothetical protein